MKGIYWLLLLSFYHLVSFTSVAAVDPIIVRNIERDLPYDGDGKLKSHVLLYHGDCTDNIITNPPYGFVSAVVNDTNNIIKFGFDLGKGNTCQAACIERGVDASLAHAIMPHKYYDENYPSFNNFFEERCRKVELCLMNYVSKERPLKLFWIHPNTGEKKLHMEIEHGEKKTRCFSSFIGHDFIAENPTTGEVVGTFKVEYTTTMAFGTNPQADYISDRNFDKEIEQTLIHEWDRHNNVKRTFSPLGFKKGRLPDDVFASMGAFFTNNKGNKVREEWGGRGVFVNWWESDCSFIQIPWDLKRIWQERLRLLVEAWAGVPVEQTDMYGLRQYEQGARLLTHVDRQSTHAVSLIVNIAQGNLTEPWPVEVQDHMDRMHEVIMEPGDIVYYESAKCLHGRNRPLTGDNAYYVNLFTHYRPTGDPNWYKKPNHDGTPEAVMEMEGTCRLESFGTAETPNGQLGNVQGVRCDDTRLGGTISPTLFTASNGNDLIDWYRLTAPPNVASGNQRDEL